MSRTVRINATLDADLLARIDAFAAVRLEDRSTAIRQLIDQALRDLSKREALQAYQQGRLTLRELARTLRLDVWAAQDLLAAEGVAVAQGGRGETAAALDGLLSARRVDVTDGTADGPIGVDGAPPAEPAPPDGDDVGLS